NIDELTGRELSSQKLGDLSVGSVRHVGDGVELVVELLQRVLRSVEERFLPRHAAIEKVRIGVAGGRARKENGRQKNGEAAHAEPSFGQRPLPELLDSKAGYERSEQEGSAVVVGKELSLHRHADELNGDDQENVQNAFPFSRRRRPQDERGEDA